MLYTHTHKQVPKRIHTLNTPTDLYKGFYPRSRQAGSLSSAGAQQGSVLARLADCAQLGASRMAQGGERRQWGETAVKKERTHRARKKRQDPQTLSRVGWWMSTLFLHCLWFLCGVTQASIKISKNCNVWHCGHLDIVLGGKNILSPFKRVDRSGAQLLIISVMWRLRQNALGWISGWLTETSQSSQGLIGHLEAFKNDKNTSYFFNKYLSLIWKPHWVWFIYEL